MKYFTEVSIVGGILRSCIISSINSFLYIKECSVLLLRIKLFFFFVGSELGKMSTAGAYFRRTGTDNFNDGLEIDI